MINLLPPETKSQITAARTNLLLLRYNVMLFIAVLFAFAAVGFSFIYLANAKGNAEKTIAYNKSKVSDYATVESEAASFRQNLTNAKQILDNDVTYTKVILEISNLMPPGVILNNLTLDSAEFGKPTVFSAKAKDYEDTLTFKNALQQSSLFSDASIQTITATDEADTTYKLTFTLSVTIDKSAAK